VKFFVHHRYELAWLSAQVVPSLTALFIVTLLHDALAMRCCDLVSEAIAFAKNCGCERFSLGARCNSDCRAGKDCPTPSNFHPLAEGYCIRVT
jgi:hypothetical protein